YQTLEESTALGILLSYPAPDLHRTDLLSRKVSLSTPSAYQPMDVVCSFLGAGNYASRVLIPAFKEGGAKLHSLASSTGISGVHHGKKHDFAHSVTDETAVYQDAEVNTIV